MGDTVVHRVVGRRQGLAQNLATEDAVGADIVTLAAKQVGIEPLEGQKLN